MIQKYFIYQFYKYEQKITINTQNELNDIILFHQFLVGEKREYYTFINL